MSTLDYVLAGAGAVSLFLSVFFAASVERPNRRIRSSALDLYRRFAYDHGYRLGMLDALNGRPAQGNPKPPENTNYLV